MFQRSVNLVLFFAMALIVAQIYSSSWRTGIKQVPTNKKIIALTYDDGPSPLYTEKILKVLKNNKVKATFFVVGSRAQKRAAIVKKVIEQGHDVGNHSWSHIRLKEQSSHVIKKEITQTDKVIKKLGYTKEIYFRSPYGSQSPKISAVLNSLHKKNILFNIMPFDWQRPGTKKIVENIVAQVKPGSIILLHDCCNGRDQTVEATDIVIKKLKAKGFTFLTIGQLLAQAKKRKSA